MISPISLYHQFPYPLKVATASLRGYYLQWWRYSSLTVHLIQEAIERDFWTVDQWKIWQDERLQYILNRAAKKTPFYQEYWAKRRRQGDHASDEILANWPVLLKESLRSNPRAFVVEDCDLRKMYSEHTSGTTGKPITLWFRRKSIIQWYALYEARIRHWNGVSRNNRWGILGGQLVTPFNKQTPPYWVWNQGLNQLYLSSYHLSPLTTRDYVKAIHDYRLEYLLGYASSLFSLAKGMVENGYKAPSVRLVLSNAEPLYDFQREVISEAFSCPVKNTYGMTEIAGAASECEAKRLHLWPDAGVVEVLDFHEDTALKPGMEGRIICTGLINEDMPLIRYEVGDRGIIEDSHMRCHCGRNLPILQNIEGRLDDMIVTPDGRKIGRLDPVFKADFDIREAQIIQEDRNSLKVKIVPAEGYSDQAGKEIVKRLQDRVGKMEIQIEVVQSIPRSSNGKFRGVINQLGKL